jgi:hypothetical protein
MSAIRVSEVGIQCTDDQMSCYADCRVISRNGSMAVHNRRLARTGCMIAIPLQLGGKWKYYGSHNLVRSSLPVLQQGLVKSGVLLDDDFRNLVCEGFPQFFSITR